MAGLSQKEAHSEFVAENVHGRFVTKEAHDSFIMKEACGLSRSKHLSGL